MAPERLKEWKVKKWGERPRRVLIRVRFFLIFESVNGSQPREVLNWNKGAAGDGWYNLTASFKALWGQIGDPFNRGSNMTWTLSLVWRVFDHFIMILRNFEVKKTSEMVRCLEESKEATECGEMFDRRRKPKNPTSWYPKLALCLVNLWVFFSLDNCIGLQAYFTQRPSYKCNITNAVKHAPIIKCSAYHLIHNLKLFKYALKLYIINFFFCI